MEKPKNGTVIEHDTLGTGCVVGQGEESDSRVEITLLFGGHTILMKPSAFKVLDWDDSDVRGLHRMIGYESKPGDCGHAS